MLTLDLSHVPELHTARLRLRALMDNDAHAVLALRSDPVAMRFVPRPLARSLDDALAHIRNIRAEQQAGTAIMWAIVRDNDPAMIGIIGLLRMQPEHYRTELGYMLLPAFWGKGYITEAIAAIAHHAFSVFRFHSLEALVDPRNVGSLRVLEHNGFVREGLLRENFLHDGVFLDTAIYSKLSSAHTP